ncbi:MAG: T9SS type A sorting domain-containing protein [Salibacteraceae bacterium]
MKYLLPFLMTFLLPMAAWAQLVTNASGSDITCFGDSNGVASVSAGVIGSGPPLVISEVNTNSPDVIEITNVSGANVNTDGWMVITSDAYNNINDVNSLTWDLPTTVPAGWVDYREDATGSNYWGNNLFYNNSSPGWVLLSDDQGNVVDFVAWEWSETEILNTFSITVSGNNYTLTTNEWSGNGINQAGCGTSLVRTGSSDNDDATDWSCGTTSAGSLNSGLNPPFSTVNISYQWNTGDTTAQITDLGPGTYIVTTTTTQGDSALDTVVITEPPIPEFTLPITDTIICSGTAFLVDAGAGWSSYTWSTNSTSQNLIVTEGGTYYITVTDSNGCPAVDTLNVSEGTAPIVNLGGDSTICANEWELNAGAGAASYSWSTGGSSQTETVTESGNYSVTVQSNDGCETIDDINLTLYPEPEVDLGPNITLCINFNETQFISAGTGFQLYQWNTGATSSSLLVGSGITEPGSENFSVLVTDENGCTATDTIKVKYELCTGTNELSKDTKISLFPNPSNGFVSISHSANSLQQVEIYDLTGKIIFKQFFENNSKTMVDLNVSHLVSGTYILKSLANDQTYINRLVIK